ncbi:hypothetical protein [Agrobacterium sp. 22-223-1]
MDELVSAPIEEVEQLFSELVRASIFASHYVIITRDACGWASDNLDLGRKYKAHLNSIKQDFTTKASILGQAKNVLKVGIGSSGLQSLTGGGYEIGHRALLRGRYLEQAVLLVENAENDGDFARSIFQILKNKHPVKHFSFDTRHGGGSTVVNCFNQELNNKRIAVCLVDSDKVAPSHPESATVKGLRQVANLGSYVGGIFVTRCREVENHLPAEIIQANNLCPSYAEYEKLSKLMYNLEAEYRSEIWLYFDIKCGFRGSDLDSKGYSKATRDWIESTYAEQGKEITDVTLSGFGPNILRQFLDSGLAMAELATHVKTPSWKQSFDGFYEEMLWFFAADRRIATI